jgi:hypothetical protein
MRSRVLANGLEKGIFDGLAILSVINQYLVYPQNCSSPVCRKGNLYLRFGKP